MSLTPDEVREHVETTLSDDALQTFIDAAVADVSTHLGAATGIVERHASDTAYIYPDRPVGSVTSITETLGLVTTLATNDYAVWPGGYVIERLVTGTNRRGYWTGVVVLTYDSVDDAAVRKRVELALVKLDLAHQPGITGETAGPFSVQYATNDYATSRANILSTLPRGVVFA